MSINRLIDKENVISIYIVLYYTYTYIMEYYSAIIKDEIVPFAATWMDLEITVLSELNQTKTNII